ncbi:hypothetical protein ATZ36_04320 [Candidatus Endomicrobiellum trichonymphae]|uniref:Uncharacterized protein n=1 Tax=Endomicrobium trichonymphae TaxID=1408204 RepID=A0A1E5IIY1_ENDTX|nr:hypothetical protein ATZ36_04320 [Candidatus Endomicrobium trichonymphae]
MAAAVMAIKKKFFPLDVRKHERKTWVLMDFKNYSLDVCGIVFFKGLLQEICARRCELNYYFLFERSKNG